jgi:ABC-type multidrug transport system permease subunit
MVLRSKENEVGAWSFLVGVVLAFVIGLATVLIPIPALVKFSSAIYGILVLLGLIIGYFSIPNGKESQTFMIAGAVLVIVSKFGMDSVTGSLIGIGIGDAVASVFGALLVLFVPATIVVALKTVFSVAKV